MPISLLKVFDILVGLVGAPMAKCYQHIKDAMKDEQKYYLLLDEVQLMPRFEEVLNRTPCFCALHEFW